jgi:uncharacterized protein
VNMIDHRKTVKKSNVAQPHRVAPAQAILTGIVFGFIFGFLLQKGGVGTYHILIGQLLLQDWTVVKIMATAIVVGMVGIFTLHRLAKVKLHIKPTKLGPNLIGGLIFGVGFALIGYCPGTAAAAVGQGSWDALFGMVGLVAGSWIYAEMSGTIKKTIEQWGDLGKRTLSDVLGVPRGAMVIAVAAMMAGLLVAIETISVH